MSRLPLGNMSTKWLRGLNLIGPDESSPREKAALVNVEKVNHKCERAQDYWEIQKMQVHAFLSFVSWFSRRLRRRQQRVLERSW